MQGTLGMSSLKEEKINIRDLERKGRAGRQAGAEVHWDEMGDCRPPPSPSAVADPQTSAGTLCCPFDGESHTASTGWPSLVAFILLLVMAFSKKWLYLSRSCFYQRWPEDVSNRICTSAHIMSLGLLYFCKSRSCSNLENGKDSLKMWTNQPMFKLAKLSFKLTLGLGLVLTIWLHLSYLPAVQKLPSFGLVGTILSFFEVTFIFSTLMLFPINIWIFEVERNVSIPIGWSYFIGWLVFILYVTCTILCYFNHKLFWSLILSHSSGAVSCSSSFGSVEDSKCADDHRHPHHPGGSPGS
ncbi:Outer dense fiber protein 4 [Plecturocebus cupreus]